MTISLDGYFADANSDMSWAHNPDSQGDFQAFVEGNTQSDSTLVFGRKTYQMMAGYWPSEMAAQQNPVVAKKMNETSKIVFSKTLDEAPWTNTDLLKGDLAEEVKKLKGEEGPPLTILGSGSVVAQLAEAGLIDEFQIVVSPIVLGSGKSLFENGPNKQKLNLKESRTFTNGNVFLRYEPKS